MESIRRACITGGHGDLARAIRQELECDGYEVSAPGRECLDMAKPDSIESWFASQPTPDLLVLNAGMSSDRRLHQLQEAHWQLVMDANLHGAFRVCRSWARSRERQMQGAHAIFISSHAACRGAAGQSVYAAAKAALIGAARSFAREWGPDGGRANVVLPGFMETRMTAGLPTGVVQRYCEEHLLDRLSQRQEVARFIRVLDQLPAVSGQIFALDSRPVDW